MTEPLAPIPEHVPPHLVRDVDIFRIHELAPEVHLGWKKIQDENPDLFYTPHNGGHWLATRAEMIERLFGDTATFVSGRGWVPLNPPGTLPQPPIQSDPPEHQFYRSFINPVFAPRPIQLLSEEARALAIQLIEGFYPRGGCEFVKEFAQHLPILVFLGMVELPRSDREWLLQHAEVVRESNEELRAQSFGELLRYCTKYIEQRKLEPGTDIISRIIQGHVGARPITDAEVVGECIQLLLGGLDTVASMLGFFARFLAQNPVHRAQLVTNPALIPQAVEELLRRYAVGNPARELDRDLEVDGVQLKKGDRFFISSCLHGLDEHRWADPLKVDFERDTRGHHSFGAGIHKCPGANLARAELKVFLEEWLKRIPDFSLEAGEQPREASGSVNGVMYLRLVWPVNKQRRS